MRVRAWAPKICKYIIRVELGLGWLVLSVEYSFFVGWVEIFLVQTDGMNSYIFIVIIAYHF